MSSQWLTFKKEVPITSLSGGARRGVLEGLAHGGWFDAKIYWTQLNAAVSGYHPLRNRLGGSDEPTIWTFIGAGLVGSALLAGPVAAQDVIRIGVTQPLTGAFAASGNYVTQGAKIAEDQINAAGGVLGWKIQLVVEDNKSNPTEAVATAEKLIDRNSGVCRALRDEIYIANLMESR